MSSVSFCTFVPRSLKYCAILNDVLFAFSNCSFCIEMLIMFVHGYCIQQPCSLLQIVCRFSWVFLNRQHYYLQIMIHVSSFPFLMLRGLLMPTRISNSILMRAAESGNPCLIPGFENVASAMSPLSITFAIAF